MSRKQFEKNSELDPLGTLLALLNEKNLNISDFSLAQVADQYLKYIKDFKDKRVILENVSEFLWVASKLALIKSKLLIEDFVFEEEDGSEIEDLKERLFEYKKFKEISNIIKVILENGQECLSKNKVFLNKDSQINFNSKDLRDFFLKVTENFKLENQDLYTRRKISEKIKIEEKIRAIQEILVKTKKIKFSEIVCGNSGKLDFVVSFLSILELVKQGSVKINQEKAFQEIYISKV